MANKNLLLSFLLLIIYNLSYSQNVGIGTTTPAYPLTVAAISNKGIVQKDGNVEVGFYTTQFGTGAAFLQTWSNHSLNFATNNSNTQMTLLTNGNFGIGATNPEQKLHVVGNAAISGNLGLGLINPSARLHVGGDGLITGSLGLGTTSPTATLDINGSFRFRNTAPIIGAVMTSTDANGNAEWAKPIAFKATGCYDNTAFVVEDLTWTKVFFNQTLSYNIGQAFQTVNSQLFVTEKGIYNLNTQLHWDEEARKSSIRIRLNRNGNISTICENYHQFALDINNDVVGYHKPSAVSTDVALEVGDIVWVEGWIDIAIGSGTSTTINANAFYTYFTGHLVARN